MNVIFDIDSTLSDPSHRLHYVTGEKKDYEAFYQACDEDTVIKGMDLLYNSFHNSLFNKIYTITGRPERIREKTRHWFKKHQLFGPHNLIMRGDDDYRKDHELKGLIVRNYMAGGIKFDLAFEDSPEVCDVYRSLGITTCQLPRH